MTSLALKLIFAHLIGDFAVQPLRWVVDKNEKSYRSKYLYVHILVHFAILNLIFLDRWSQYIGSILFISISHLIIDIAKIEYNKRQNHPNFNAFLLDQLAHFAVIGLVISRLEPLSLPAIDQKIYWIAGIALVLQVFAIPLIIKIFIQRWAQTLGDSNRSLLHAGYYIGVLERSFIILFVLLHLYEGIGFLLAAKSIFRIGDLKENKEKMLTEYILLGTLVSFLLALVLGLWLQWEMNI